MYFLYLFFVIMGAFAVGWMVPLNPADPAQYRIGEANSYAKGMIVYHQAAQRFHHDNPGYVGTVAAGQLNLPDGYKMTTAWQAQVAAGNWVIVSTIGLPFNVPAGTLARDIQVQKDNSAGSGIIQGGQLVSARFAPVTLPVALPDGAVVIATKGG